MAASLPQRTEPFAVFGFGMKVVFLSFPPNGAGAIASFTGNPIIKSCTRTGVGTFAVVIDAALNPKAFLGLVSQYANATATPGTAEVSVGPATIVAGSDTTFNLYTTVAGALADIAANAANLVIAGLLFKCYPKTDASGL